MTEESNSGNNNNHEDQQNMHQIENFPTPDAKPDESNVSESQQPPELIPAPLASAPPPPPPIASTVQAPPPPPLPPTTTTAVPQIPQPPRPSSIPTPPQMPQQFQQNQPPPFPTAVQPYQPMQNLYPAPMTPSTMPSVPFQIPMGMSMFQQQQPQQMPGFNPTFFINMATFMHKIQTATNKYQQEIITLVYEFQMNTLSSGNNIQIPNFQPSYSQMQPGPMIQNSYPQYPQQQMYQQPHNNNNPYSNPSPPAPVAFKSVPKPSQQNNSKLMAPPNLLEEIQAAGGIEFLRRKKSNAKQPQQQPIS